MLESFELGADLFELTIDKTNIAISPFADKQGLFIQIKVPFQSPLMTTSTLPKIKLDLSKNEILVDNPHSSLLLHAYSDSEIVETSIQSYSLDEIFSEKCRALVQRTRPRDLYDVIELFERRYQSKEDISNFLRIAEIKFLYKGLSFPQDLLRLSEAEFSEARKAWSHMLAHQINPLDAMESYLDKFNTITNWLTASRLTFDSQPRLPNQPSH